MERKWPIKRQTRADDPGIVWSLSFPPRHSSRVGGLIGRCFALLFLLALFCPAQSEWREPLVLEASRDGYALGERLDYLEDRSRKLVLADVRSPDRRHQFRPSPDDSPSFGFTPSAYWFYTDIHNLDNPIDRWLLELQYPLLDEVDLFLFANGRLVEQQHTGDRIPFADRPVHGRTLLFELDLPKGSKREIMLRVQTTSSLQMPAFLWSEAAFYEADRNRQILFGIYYGIIFSIAVYNLLLFASLRETVYLYYVGYLFCFALFQASLNGLAYEYLWPSYPIWSEHATPFFISAASLMAIQFSRSLLQVWRVLPRIDVWLKFFSSVLAVLAMASLMAPYSAVISIATAFGLTTSIVLNILGWVCWRKRVAVGAFYVAAWTTFLLGATTYALKTYTLLPENFFTEYAIQIGSALEVLLLSFALAHRVKLLEEDNRRIQVEATQQLEQRVAMRTEELNEALEDLSRVNTRLEALSQTDALTGLYNRSYFDLHFPRLWASAQRGRSGIAVLMLDVDHFKQINDSLGHLGGDRVLAEVAKTIDGALKRQTDVLARYGGEEFVVVLSHVTADGSLQVAERIRTRVADLRLRWTGGTVNPRVSIGVAFAKPGRNDKALKLLEYADSALYDAKATGRDRVVVASAPNLQEMAC